MQNLYSQDKQAIEAKVDQIVGRLVRELGTHEFDFRQFSSDLLEWVSNWARRTEAIQVFQQFLNPALLALQEGEREFAKRPEGVKAPCALVGKTLRVYMG